MKKPIRSIPAAALALLLFALPFGCARTASPDGEATTLPAAALSPAAGIAAEAGTTAPQTEDRFLFVPQTRYADAQPADYLVLVNRRCRIPADWEDRICLESAVNRWGETVLAEKATLEAFYALQADLQENDGILIEPDSAYRGVKRQQEIWDEFVRDNGPAYTRRYVARPGFSEHHTGLAIDIDLVLDGRRVDDNERMIREKKTFAPIHAKLAEHGFILRYPEGKKAVTGYDYEPWHIRYVGVAAAKEIAEKGLTLEEYIRDIQSK